MKNNTFSVQYSDEIITKSISRAQEDFFCMWAEIIGPLSNWFRFIGGSLGSVLLKNLELRRFVFRAMILFP